MLLSTELAEEEPFRPDYAGNVKEMGTLTSRVYKIDIL